MKLLVAIDSFKGCASSKELNDALIDVIHHPSITEKISVPIADGGEGTLEALKHTLSGKMHTVRVPDLQGQLIDVDYLVCIIDGEATAFIESAKVIGIDLINPNEETLLTTNSYGLGVLVTKIIESGIKVIYISLGGSGTSDGGLGFLAGLGVPNIEVDVNNPLYTSKKIELEKTIEQFKEIQLIALADVTNPYCGPNGFSFSFGKQKGGSHKQLHEMDILAQQIEQELSRNKPYNVGHVPGSGAAGGLGGAILAIGGSIQPGFKTISELLSLEQLISQVDFVITGEGKIDEQTNNGKVPFGIATLCKKYHKPVFAVCGKRTDDIGELSDLILGAFSIHLGPVSFESAMDKETTLRNLQITGRELVNVLLD